MFSLENLAEEPQGWQAHFIDEETEAERSEGWALGDFLTELSWNPLGVLLSPLPLT